jgi:hypothetical protein
VALYLATKPSHVGDDVDGLTYFLHHPTDEDLYLGYHPTETQKAQGGVHYDSAHHLKDSRGPWHAPQGIDSFI